MSVLLIVLAAVAAGIAAFVAFAGSGPDVLIHILGWLAVATALYLASLAVPALNARRGPP